jgi:hypothetical protein
MILQNVDDFKELEKEIYKLVCKITREKLKEVLKLIDKEIMKNRDKKIFENKDMRERTIKTIVGPLTIKRRYYEDINGNYHFLLDEYLNIPNYDRQSPGLKDAALEIIKDLSYRKTAEKVEKLLGVSSSPSAIHNWVQKFGSKIAKEADKKRHELFEYGAIPEGKGKRKELDHIFVEVDGIHLSLQKEEKDRGELKLGISYQGWEKRHPSSEEYNLTGKKYYGGVFSSNRFWEETTAKLYEDYRFKKQAVTVLNGDGAPWITTGQEYIPDLSVRQLDSFHWNTKIYRKLGRSSYIPKIYDAIEAEDKPALKKHLRNAKSYRKKKKDKEKVDELETYLLNHWEALQDYRSRDLDLPDSVRGVGAIESNIDKVLANRFKKQGMRWSKEGARNLAKIIIADRNGKLEQKLAKTNWKFNKKELKKEYRTVKKKISREESEVIKAQMPALEGPDSGKDWIKGLKNISAAGTHTPICVSG